MILAVNDLNKSYDGKDILKDISFHMEAHDKLAITGINGAGKTTLLRQIIGEEQPDSGTVVIPREARIGYLSQVPDIESDRTIYEEVVSVRSDLLEAEKTLRELEQKMQHAGTDDAGVLSDNVFDRYAALSHRFESEGGYALRSNVTGILKGLGFREDEFDKKVSVLSGGQKTRLSLGRLLLDSPDILILDEPTNHLDIDSVAWLEGYLRSWKGAVIIVSHDNEMVYNYCDETVVLSHGKIVYHGPTDELFADKEKLKEYNMLEPQIVVFRNALIEKGFTLSRNARTLEQIADEVARQVKR